MSTTVAYLTKRLNDLGRDDLLAAVASGALSTFAAAVEAGLVQRPPVSGNGSENQAKKRAWANMKATGRGPLPSPHPGAPAPKPPPPNSAAPPQVSPQTPPRPARP